MNSGNLTISADPMLYSMITTCVTGPEHVLLAITRDPSAARASAEALGVPVDQVRTHVLKSLREDNAPATESMLPFTSRAKNVLENAIDAARDAHQTSTGMRELLIGLLNERRSIAARALGEVGVTADGLARAR